MKRCYFQGYFAIFRHIQNLAQN